MLGSVYEYDCLNVIFQSFLASSAIVHLGYNVSACALFVLHFISIELKYLK